MFLARVEGSVVATKKDASMNGRKLLLRFAKDLAEHGASEGLPKLEGRNAHVIISPIKKDAVKDKAKKPGEGQPPQPRPATAAIPADKAGKM